MLQEAGHIKNINYIYSCFDFPAHSMFTFDKEVAWVLVSSGSQTQPQIILNPDYLPDYLSISNDYGPIESVTVFGCLNFTMEILFLHLL